MLRELSFTLVHATHVACWGAGSFWPWYSHLSEQNGDGIGNSWMVGSGRGRIPLTKALEFIETLPQGDVVQKVALNDFNDTVFDLNFRSKNPLVLQGVVEKWSATTTWFWNNLVDANGRFVPFHTVLKFALEKHFPALDVPHAHLTNETLFLDGLLTEQPFSVDCPYAHMTAQDIGGHGLLGHNYLPALNMQRAEERNLSANNVLIKDEDDNLATIHTYIIAGPVGSGGVLHTDPDSTAYWNALVHGRKLWMFVTPQALDKLAKSIIKLDEEVFTQVSQMSDDSTLLSKRRTLALTKRILTSIPAIHWFASLMPLLRDANITFPHQTVVLAPGELIYGPPNLFHIVIALEDSIGCSEQLVDSRNLLDFLFPDTADYRSEEALLSCRVGRKYWADLIKPLGRFCSKVESYFSRIAPSEDKPSQDSGTGPGTKKGADSTHRRNEEL